MAIYHTTVDIKSYTDELTRADIIETIADKLRGNAFDGVEFVLTDRNGAADVFVKVETKEA
ncbi:hypothetical protein SEA_BRUTONGASTER_146 [Gordonia phage BrutonGaster]|uniref:Uncharacterized protein n=1 Tax=Gordonia phage BrutonGaster TaxID=2530116 RepID=A0A482JMQ6_9CAUD|nr:hypothetical protein HOV26_gp036 [Gordonia phage BrutonGaster]QBP33360.1 hypothetical protein SEA_BRUTONGASTER_146 [Gordonia phage BrutonGaster]